ncbi:MAG: hypothetical protein IIA66_13455 [Planctomycetes bacterium]|nr:hypothetical protein [Planctomycetota bacterium]
MPALRVYVRPPHKHTGLMILCAFYGITFGCIPVLLGRVGPWLAIWLIFAQGMWGFGAIMSIIMFCGILVPPVIVACSLARSCQHKLPTFLCGQVLGSCIGVPGSISQFFLFPGSMLLRPWWQHLVQVLGCLVAGAVVGLSFLLVRFMYVNFVSVLVEQDGTLCVKCGYCIAQSPSERCSECGAPVDTALRQLGRVQRFAEFLGSRTRQMAYLAAFLVSVGAAFLAWHHLPVWRFSSTIAREEQYTISQYVPVGGQSRGVLGLGPEVAREVTIGTLTGVLVVHLHRPAFYKAPLVQLRLATKVPFPGVVGIASQSGYFLLDGIPRVVCELNEIQTRSVLKHDIPQRLIDALVEAAEEAGWTPATFTPPVLPKPDIVVAADGHFPASENGEK